MPSKPSKALENKLIEKGAMPPEMLEEVVELSEMEFRHSLEDTASVLLQRLGINESMYRRAQEYSKDYHVYYYSTSSGNIGYIVGDKKGIGFELLYKKEEEKRNEI